MYYLYIDLEQFLKEIDKDSVTGEARTILNIANWGAATQNRTDWPVIG